jgi:hypothetical protein
LLAGEIGGAVGVGIQAEGVLAVAKHYVANNFEWLRTREGSLPRRSDAIDIRVSSRTLHEIYLEPFRRALVRHGVAGLLASYNRLNGRYVCEDPDLLDIPRTRWGWAGGIADQVHVAPAADGELPLPVASAESAAGLIEAVIRDDVTGTEVRRTLSRFELRAPEGVGPDCRRR